jgi:hypothetical protein
VLVVVVVDLDGDGDVEVATTVDAAAEHVASRMGADEHGASGWKLRSWVALLCATGRIGDVLDRQHGRRFLGQMG